MNRMEFEAIKHDAAKRIFADGKYKWWNMLDNTEEADRLAVQRCGSNETELFKFWIVYFNDLYVAMDWSNRDEHR